MIWSSSYYIILYIIGKKISYEFKWRYLKSILTKDPYWYDNRDVKEIPSQVYANLEAVEDASGISMGFVMFSISAWVTGCITSLYISVNLGILYSLVVPYWIVVAGYQTSTLDNTEQKLNKAFLKSSGKAEETLTAVKVVKAFGQESAEANKFTKYLEKDQNELKKQSWPYGFSLGLLESTVYFARAYSFIIAALFILNDVRILPLTLYLFFF